MGGFWELPGGKIEHKESPEQAITRELNEELGIQVKHSSLHQTMVYHYEDRIVELSIYNINQYQHTPIGLEGQAITWDSLCSILPPGNSQNPPINCDFLRCAMSIS
jgi:8-oxo-dGTP diphosphatase